MSSERINPSDMPELRCFLRGDSGVQSVKQAEEKYSPLSQYTLKLRYPSVRVYLLFNKNAKIFLLENIFNFSHFHMKFVTDFLSSLCKTELNYCTLIN